MRILMAVLFTFTFSCAAFPQAQMSSGDVKGTVADSTGGVITNAKVTVTNIETGVSRTAATGTDGTFRLNGLASGRVDLTVLAPGFAPYTTTVDVPMPSAHDRHRARERSRTTG